MPVDYVIPELLALLGTAHLRLLNVYYLLHERYFFYRYPGLIPYQVPPRPERRTPRHLQTMAGIYRTVGPDASDPTWPLTSPRTAEKYLELARNFAGLENERRE